MRRYCLLMTMRYAGFSNTCGIMIMMRNVIITSLDNAQDLYDLGDSVARVAGDAQGGRISELMK